jgi:hypothetical protein
LPSLLETLVGFESLRARQLLAESFSTTSSDTHLDGKPAGSARSLIVTRIREAYDAHALDVQIEKFDLD